MRYSIWSLINQALTGNRNWTPVWREPEPKSHYDIVIVGGGGHGLATAFYLASRYDMKILPFSKKAGLDLAILGAIQQLFGQIIFLMATCLFTNNR